MKILDKNHHILGDFGLDKNRVFGHLLTQAFEGTFGGPLITLPPIRRPLSKHRLSSAICAV